MACVCKEQKVILMKNLAGEDVVGYPVYVYNIIEEYIGRAKTKEEYITLWNSDIVNNSVGELYGYYGKFVFILNVRPGKLAPEYVIGDQTGVIPDGVLLDSDGMYLIDNDSSPLIDLV